MKTNKPPYYREAAIMIRRCRAQAWLFAFCTTWTLFLAAFVACFFGVVHWSAPALAFILACAVGIVAPRE